MAPTNIHPKYYLQAKLRESILLLLVYAFFMLLREYPADSRTRLKTAIIISGEALTWHNELCYQLAITLPGSRFSVVSVAPLTSQNLLGQNIKDKNPFYPKRLKRTTLMEAQRLPDPSALSAWLAHTMPDVIVNLSGALVSFGNTPCLILEVSGDSSERSWYRQAIDPAHYPILIVRETASGDIYAHYRIACNSRSRIVRAVDNLYSYASEAIRIGIVKLLKQLPHKEPEAIPEYNTPWRTVLYCFVRQSLSRRLFADRFEVSWRQISSGAESIIIDHAKMAEMMTVPQPPGHYYADPFLMRYNGDPTPFIMLEDYSYRQKKGTLRAFSLNGKGNIKIIDDPFHHSYPQVFEHKGKMYMVPDSSAAEQVRIYTMGSDHTRWKEVTVLLEGIKAADPTLYYDGTRWWMFVTIPTGEYDYCNDTLHLYYADDITGPYHHHPMNPIVTDALRARPAGSLFHTGNSLIRPSQDCGRKYGAALNFNKIEEMTPTRYRETLWKHIEPPEDYSGLHHYHRLGDYEVVDMQKKLLRFGAKYR